MLNTALFWHSLGITTIPMAYRTKQPLYPWKRYKHTLPSVKTLTRWLGGSQKNLAIVTTGNLVVLDFDNPIEFAQWFCVMSDSKVTDTYTVLTSRGFHLYYWIEEEFEPIKISKPYEIKSHGRLITVPPSVHPSGIPYRAINSPDKIKTVSSINDILTFPPVKFERSKIKATYDPWQVRSTNGFTDRVDLLDLFPDARQTDVNGRYFITDCPLHQRKNNFWLDTEYNICGCYAGCGNFLASEIVEIMK